MEKMKFRLPYSERHHCQSDEDGIILHLVKALKEPTKKCVEIGWGSDVKSPTGISINCTQNLVQNHKYHCTAFDMKRQLKLHKNVTFHRGRITPNKCKEIIQLFDKDVDVFSLDIDSYDYEVMTNLINLNFRPSIICAEINRKFSYDAIGSFPYIEDCNHYSKTIFHGVSYKKYRQYFESIGYKFFSISSNSVNIFFYDPSRINESLLSTERLETNDSYADLLDGFKQRMLEHEFWKDYQNDIFK